MPHYHVKEGVHQFYKFVLKCRVRYTVLTLNVIFLKSASTQHGSCSGSRELVLREHNLGSLEHNLGSPGTQSSRFEENHI